MNVIRVPRRIAAMAKMIDDQHVAPVAWDCNSLEEACGECTTVINTSAVGMFGTVIVYRKKNRRNLTAADG